MSDPGHRPGDEEEERPPGAVERWVLPYFEDSSLWPVLIVVLAALAAFMAPALASGIRDLHLLSLVAILILLIGTIRLIRWEWGVRGRPGGISLALVIVWAMAATAAYYGARAGML